MLMDVVPVFPFTFDITVAVPEAIEIEHSASTTYSYLKSSAFILSPHSNIKKPQRNKQKKLQVSSFFSS